MCNHLRHILLSYFKTLSVGPVWGLPEPWTSRSAVWCFTNWANQAAVPRWRHWSCLIPYSSIFVLGTAKNYKVKTKDSKLNKYLIKKYRANKVTFQKRPSMHKTGKHVAFTTVTRTRGIRRGAGNKLSLTKAKSNYAGFLLLLKSPILLMICSRESLSKRAKVYYPPMN